MKLWIVTQLNAVGYDCYDSFVVASETEEEARNTHPNGDSLWDGKNWWYIYKQEKRFLLSSDSWTIPNEVRVEYLGETDREIKGVVLASFNAG